MTAQESLHGSLANRLVEQIRILHFVPGLDSISGGPSRSVPYQCVSTLNSDHLVSLACIETGLPLAPEVQDVGKRGVNVCTIRPSSIFSQLPPLLRQHDVTHLHGMWSPSCYWVARWTLQLGRALIITPHGTLEPWALDQKKWRKRLALWTYQRAILNRATVIQATSDLELHNLRQLELRSPLAMIPHGVTVPDYLDSLAGTLPRKRILFLSRIHPKKGLIHLVRALAKHLNTIERDNWLLTIAGPDPDCHLAKVVAEAEALNVAPFIEFVGNVDGPQKWELYRSSALFVLPTFSENFGLVVAEALGCGVPVVTTHGAPWSDLVSNNCGWWHPIGQAHLDAALGQALTTPPQVLRQMGERGMALVRQRYGVTTYGDDFRQMYDWACNGRAAEPTCFH